jgi:hypothetical protein
MAICRCGLPACCCQPAVAGGVIYADLWGELITHLALQALFTQSSVHEPLLQAFPFPITLWEVTLLLVPQACVFVYSLRGKWVFPPLLWGFPPSATLTSFPPPGCWAHTLTPTRASLSHPSYLQFREGFPSPILFATCLYCSYCLLFSFAFFPGWRSVCPGGYAVLAQGCLWEYHVLLSSPCPRLPKPPGRERPVVRGPSQFLRLT